MGHDEYGWCYDGRTLMHNNEVVLEDAINYEKWKSRDVIGCGVDIDNKTIKYYLNGKYNKMEFKNCLFNEPLCPVLQFTEGQIVEIKFKKDNFTYPMPAEYQDIIFEDEKNPLRFPIPQKFHQNIIKSRYALISKPPRTKFNADMRNVDDTKHGIYQFDALRNIEFIIPQFQEEKADDLSHNVGIYVQPEENLRFVLIKVFKARKKHITDPLKKLEYLLNLLQTWKLKIVSPQSFYTKIGFEWKPEWAQIARTRYRNILSKPTKISTKVTVMTRLVQELGAAGLASNLINNQYNQPSASANSDLVCKIPTKYRYNSKDNPFVAIDKLVGNYYIDLRVMTYFNCPGDQGKFGKFVKDTTMDKYPENIPKMLGLECRSENCMYTAFDEQQFPLHKDINAAVVDPGNSLTKNDVIFYVLQFCYRKHKEPSHQDLLRIIERRKKIKITTKKAVTTSAYSYNAVSEGNGTVIEIHNEMEFLKYILNGEITKLIVVDFAATWCPFSKRYDAKYKALAREYTDKVILLKVTTDRQDDADGGQWCRNWKKTQAVPEFQFWKNCAVLDHFSGALEDRIRANIRRFM